MVASLDTNQSPVLRQRNAIASQLTNEDSSSTSDVATSNGVESTSITNSERSKLVVHSSPNYGSFPRSGRRRSVGDDPLDSRVIVTTANEPVVNPGDKTICTEVKAVLSAISNCFPFCCCEPSEHEKKEENSQQVQSGQERRPAGWISALKTCFCLLENILSESNIPWLIYVLVLTIVFFMSIWISESQENIIIDPGSQSEHNYLKDSNIKILLLISMILGFFGEIYCLCKKKDRSLVRFTHSHSDHSHSYLLAGVYVFGSGTLFMIIQRLFAYPHATVVSKCSSSSTNGTSSEIILKYPEIIFCSADIIYNSVRLIFTATQILFLQGFSKATFCKTVLVKWILFHTMATNICVWITYVVSETGLFRNISFKMTWITINVPKANFTTPDPAASDWILEETEKLTEILIPFTLEYSLIVAGILYAISSNMKKFPENIGDGDNKNTHENQTGDVFMGSDLVKMPGRLREVVPHGSQPGLLWGMLVAIILIAAALTLDDHNKSHRDHCLQFFFSFQCFLYASQIFAFVKIIFALQAHTNHPHTLRPDDVLLLIGFVGSIALDLPLGYAAYKYKQKYAESSTNMLITLTATSIMAFELLVQVLVILFAQRYDCARDTNAIKSAKTIRQCSLFLLVTNLSIWALHSFIEIKNFAHSSYPFAQVILGQNWKSIVAITYPICIFFQFHSAAMLFELWHKFKFPAHYRKERENLVFMV